MYRRLLGSSPVKNTFKFVSTKMDTVFKVESFLEFDACFYFEFSPDVLSYEAQPLGFIYQYDGKSHSYTPDFKINHKIEGNLFLEIKPHSKANKIDFTEGFRAKREAAEKLNIPLILVTEKQIRNNSSLTNLKLLQRYSDHLDLTVEQIDLLNELRRIRKTDIKDLMAYTRLPKEKVVTLVLNLASKHHLSFNLDDDILNINTKIVIEENGFNHDIFHDEFKTLVASSELEDTPILIPRDLDSYPEHIKAEVRYRLAFLHWIKARIRGGWTERNLGILLAQASIELGEPAPCWRSAAQWWSDYSKSNFDVTSIIPRHHEKGNRKPRFNRLEESLTNIAISDYLQKDHRSVTSIYEKYKTQFILQNEYRPDLKEPIHCISYQGFCKRINKLSKFEIISTRESKSKAKSEFRYVDTHIPPSRVLERVELDHTILHLILLDDMLRIPLGRACLTLLIDSFSRCIIGFSLGFDDPGYNPVRHALLNAFKPKDYVHEMYPDIINYWPCYGKPELIVVDNGAEFWGKSIEQSCKELKINIQYNPVRNPWLKPKIEGSFALINKELIDNIPGKTISTLIDNYEYDPQKDAIMGFSKFLSIFHKWIIDDYHRDSDSRETFIPYLLWQEGASQFPPKTFSDEEKSKFDIILGIPSKSFHSKGGIHIHSLRYDSEELANYRKSYNENELKKKVLVKTNPDDISSIYVYIDKIHKYLKVPCVDRDGYTTELSLFQHNINKKIHREYIGNKIDIVQLAKVRDLIRSRIQQEIDLMSSTTRKNKLKNAHRMAKYQGVHSQKNSSIVTESSKLDYQVELNSKNEISTENTDDWDEFISRLDPY